MTTRWLADGTTTTGCHNCSSIRFDSQVVARPETLTDGMYGATSIVQPPAKRSSLCLRLVFGCQNALPTAHSLLFARLTVGDIACASVTSWLSKTWIPFKKVTAAMCRVCDLRLVMSKGHLYAYLLNPSIHHSTCHNTTKFVPKMYAAPTLVMRQVFPYRTLSLDYYNIKFKRKGL